MPDYTYSGNYSDPIRDDESLGSYSSIGCLYYALIVPFTVFYTLILFIVIPNIQLMGYICLTYAGFSLGTITSLIIRDLIRTILGIESS